MRKSSPEVEATQNGDVFFNVRLPRDLHTRLAQFAEKNERTIAAEVRMAVRERLERAA